MDRENLNECDFFSEEEKFNLEESGASQYHWQNLKIGDKLFSKWPFVKVSLNIRGILPTSGTTAFLVKKRETNSSKFISVLEISLIPFLNDAHKKNVIFRQFNAAIVFLNLTIH